MYLPSGDNLGKGGLLEGSVRFKRFIDVGVDIGAKHIINQIGILSYQDNKQRKKLLKTRIIKNWHLIGEYASKKKIKSLIWEPLSLIHI